MASPTPPVAAAAEGTPAGESTPPPVAPLARKPLAPIVEAKGDAPGEATADPARDATGRFIKESEAELGGYEEIDPDTQRPINPHNYPKATLPGMPSEELDKTREIRAHRRKPMREQFAAIGKAMAGGEGGANGAAQPSTAAKDGQTAAVTPQPAVDGQVVASADLATDPPVPASAASKFTIRSHRDPQTGQWVDESWDTFEKFQDHFRTLRGMHKASEKTKAEAVRDAQSNYESAAAWKAKAEAYERGELQLPAKSNGSGGNGNGAAAQSHSNPGQAATATAASVGSSARAPEEEYLEAVDWAKYKLVDEQHGPKVAAAWLAQQTVRFTIEKVNQQLADRDRPAKEEAEAMTHGRAIRAQIEEMREWTVEDGSAPFYPELRDPATLPEIASAIHQLSEDGMTLEYLKTPKGIHQAILLWRNWRERTGKPWAANGNGIGVNHSSPNPTAPPPPGSGNGVSEAIAAVAHHNAGVIAGRNAPNRIAPPATNEDLVRRAITGPQRKSDLGYAWE